MTLTPAAAGGFALDDAVRMVLVGCVVAAMSIPPLTRWLVRGGRYDVPNERSSHSTAVPRGAGLAVIVASVAAVVTAADGSRRVLAPAVAAVVFGIIGAVEDFWGLSPGRRLAAQGIAALLAAVLLEQAEVSLIRHVAQIAAVAVFVVVVCNAVNFMDGINGITSAQVLSAGISSFAYGRLEEVGFLQIGGVAVIGAILGFLPFNFPRARIFLGDSGSYFLGAWLSLFAAAGFVQGLNPLVLVAPLTLYGADTLVTVLGRLRRRQPIMSPHREHAYQRLVQCGWSHPRTTLLVLSLSLSHGIIGVLVRDSALALQVLGAVVIASSTAVYLILPGLVGRRGAGARAAPGHRTVAGGS